MDNWKRPVLVFYDACLNETEVTALISGNSAEPSPEGDLYLCTYKKVHVLYTA